MIVVADASAPCQDECEDQELSSCYKVDLLVYKMELTGEKADNDVQYRTGNVLRRPMLVSERDQSYHLL